METLLVPTKTTHDEKLQAAMERIREERALIDDSFESPAWHEAALREAEEDVKSGKMKFVDWEVAKKRIRRRIRAFRTTAKPLPRKARGCDVVATSEKRK